MRIILGPGPDREHGEDDVFVDRVKKWADKVCDFTKQKLPFEDNVADYVECFHVLEHIEFFKDYKKLIHEVYRVLKSGGIFDIKVPHKDHPSAWATSDHVRYFIDLSFNDFTIENPYIEEQGYSCKFEYDLKKVNMDNDVPKEIHVRLKKVK